MSRTNQEPLQISVKEASKRLQLTERTILNFIKLRRVDAIKVGKEWFIDYPSFVSFGQRYKFKDFTEATETATAIPPETLPQINSQGTNFKSETKTQQAKMGLSSLRVFQHCALLFESANFKKDPTQDYEKRVRQLSFFTLEDLGAGYHSFGIPMKLKYYSQARCHLGAILALVLQNDERKSSWHKEKEEIESRILPAFTALLRKIEKRPAPRVFGDT